MTDEQTERVVKALKKLDDEVAAVRDSLTKVHLVLQAINRRLEEKSGWVSTPVHSFVGYPTKICSTYDTGVEHPRHTWQTNTSMYQCPGRYTYSHTADPLPGVIDAKPNNELL